MLQSCLSHSAPSLIGLELGVLLLCRNWVCSALPDGRQKKRTSFLRLVRFKLLSPPMQSQKLRSATPPCGTVLYGKHVVSSESPHVPAAQLQHDRGIHEIFSWYTPSNQKVTVKTWSPAMRLVWLQAHHKYHHSFLLVVCTIAVQLKDC